MTTRPLPWPRNHRAAKLNPRTKRTKKSRIHFSPRFSPAQFPSRPEREEKRLGVNNVGSIRNQQF